MVKKGLTQANTLRSNNTTSTGYGIVYADEIIGGRSVKTRKDLDNLPDWVLGEDDGLDIGTTCYVQDEDCQYIYGGNGWYKSFKFIGLPVNAWYAYTTSAGASGELKANVLDIANFIKSDDLYMDVVDSLPHPFSTIVVFNQDAEDNSAPVAYITLFASYDSRPSGGTTIVASAKVFGAITNNTFPKTPNFNNINYYEGSCKTDTSTKITNWELTGGIGITSVLRKVDRLTITGNTIKTSEIDFTTDTLQKFNNSVSDTSHNICAQYSVVDVTHNNIVGQMLLIGDSLGHMVTEILTTSATLNNGVINWNEHSDTVVNTYIRRNHVKEGGNSSIAVGSWSTWTYYSGEGQFNDFKILVAKELNKKVNTSDIVQKTGDSTTSVMSQKAVTDAIIYDVSSHNNGAVFESLQALLSSSNLNTLIPPSVRCGGISIRFIQGSVPNSYNKYVRYNYLLEDITTNSKFTDVANWQGVNEELLFNSKDTVTAEGVYKSIFVDDGELVLKNVKVGYPNDDGSWDNYTSYKSILIRVYEGTEISFDKKDSTFNYTKYYSGDVIGSLTRIYPKQKLPTNGEVYIVPQGMTYIGFIFNNDGTYTATLKMAKRLSITMDKIDDNFLALNKFYKTCSFSSGESYPWFNILRNLNLKAGQIVYFSVETQSTDRYWIATRTENTTKDTTDIVSGSKSGMLTLTQDASVLALGVRQMSSYTGEYKITIEIKDDDGSVTTDKIQDGAVTNEKLSKDISGKSVIVKNIKSSTQTYQSYVLFPYNFVNAQQYKIKVTYNTEDDVSDLYFSVRTGANSGIIQNNIGRGTSSREVIFTYTGASQDANLVITMVAPHDSTLSYTVVLLGGENDSIGELDIRVSNLESVVSFGTGILDFNPEKEILPVLKDFKHRIRNASFVEQAKQLVLLQLTDQHGDETRMNRAMQFASKYGAYIDDVIHTGDLVYDYWSNGIDWFANVQNKNNILQVIGNHDIMLKAGSDGKIYTNPNDLSQYIETSGYVDLNKTTHTVLGYKNSDNEMVWVNYTDIYGRYIAPYVSNWGVVQPSNAALEGLNYYYKDYTEQGIRLIVLDCMMYDTAQNTWLISVLEDAKTNGYGVIIAEHYPIQLDGFEYCAFTSSGSDDVLDFYQSEGYTSTLTNAQLAVDNFMNTGGEFICWLAGHTHKDFCGTLKNYPKQVMIVSDITGLNHLLWGDEVRTVGTKTEDCFSIISIDRYKKIVRLYRVGNQWDRYGRHKVSMAFDYRAAKMIYSS